MEDPIFRLCHCTNIAVVGAGLAGLLAAQGLKKNGFDVIVFERAASVEDVHRDWTMMIPWDIDALQRLVPTNILEALQDVVCNTGVHQTGVLEDIPVYNGLTGDLLFRKPTPEVRLVTRQRLRRILVQDLDVRWGMTVDYLKTVPYGVRLSFKNGEAHEADYILGADGWLSRIRQLLMGSKIPRLCPSGYLLATGITKHSDPSKTEAILEAGPVASIMMGMKVVGTIGVMSVEDPQDLSTWTTFWTKLCRGVCVNLGGRNALEYIKDCTPPLRDMFQSAIDWTPAGSIVHINEMYYWVPQPWNNIEGRVTLAGDAAHLMLHYGGQGWQHAVMDAENYVATMLRVENGMEPPAIAFQEYDAEILQRGQIAVQESLQEAKIALDPSRGKEMLEVPDIFVSLDEALVDPLLGTETLEVPDIFFLSQHEALVNPSLGMENLKVPDVD
ncbi:hypothetical protein E4U37_007173 [Claviceps purpurea]|nr:hypothetical protein E4U37_007173 [Claviceps purpurea]